MSNPTSPSHEPESCENQQRMSPGAKGGWVGGGYRVGKGFGGVEVEDFETWRLRRTL